MDTSLNGLTSGKYLITGMDHLLIGGLYKAKSEIGKRIVTQNIDEAQPDYGRRRKRESVYR